MGRTLVLWVPLWSVIAAQWHDDHADAVAGRSVAIVHKGVVQECSPEASHAGVRAGLKRREAHRRCPEIVCVPHSTHRDNAVFERVIIALGDTVPHHTLLQP